MIAMLTYTRIAASWVFMKTRRSVAFHEPETAWLKARAAILGMDVSEVVRRIVESRMWWDENLRKKAGRPFGAFIGHPFDFPPEPPKK